MQSKQAQASLIVNKYMGWSFGAGFIPVPALDIVTVAGVQLKMVSELAQLYEIPFAENRAKSLIAALVGGVVPTGLTWGGVGSLVKSIPGIGTVAGIFTLPAIASASTYAVGKVFIQHFESGGTFLDFEPETVKEYFNDQFEEGKTSSGKKAAAA